jgi:MoxR-like ATPase
MVDIRQSDDRIIQQIEEAAVKIHKAREETESLIFGQQRVIEQSLITLLSGGHAILIGVPGLAKTSLVETLGAVLGLDAKRIQFTPDLMPSDIIGSEVLEESETRARSFRFIPGPVFTQLLMADEVNRASPKTQSALLQAMQEHHVTVAGASHELPAPFHVLATQNPLEQEGTYPLPEAQLDRFLLEINVDYPDEAAERQMLLATTSAERRKPARAIEPDELIATQRLVREMPVGEKVVDAILRVVRAARPGTPEALPRVNDLVVWGPGPRATQAMMLTIRARALLDGRLSPSIDDVAALAAPVLRHRMALSFSARAEDVSIDDVIGDLTALLN